MSRRIKVWIDTGLAGADYEDYQELPDDWDEMPADDQQEYLNSVAGDYAANYISWGAEVEDGDD